MEIPLAFAASKVTVADRSPAVASPRPGAPGRLDGVTVAEGADVAEPTALWTVTVNV